MCAAVEAATGKEP